MRLHHPVGVPNEGRHQCSYITPALSSCLIIPMRGSINVPDSMHEHPPQALPSPPQPQPLGAIHARSALRAAPGAQVNDVAGLFYRRRPLAPFLSVGTSRLQHANSIYN